MFKNKIRLAVIIASFIITYFLFFFARTSAVAARGTDATFGGEFLILLLPVILYIIYENVKLSVKTYRRNRQKKTSSGLNTGIIITGIESIDIQKGDESNEEVRPLLRSES